LLSNKENADMDTVDRIKGVLRDALNIGARADALSPSSRLLGAIPEFDSMAVVSVLTMIEDDFDVSFDDDEVSADMFETLGSLAEFVERKKAG
jgi:acyl carrier protein